MYHHYSNTNHYLESNRRWIPNSPYPQHTHATLASQYLYSATSTHHLPLRTSTNAVQGFRSKLSGDPSSNACIGVRPALNGLGIYQPATQWNFNRQPCNGSPMQVDGRGDSLPSFPSFPSTNMSDCTASHIPEDLSTTLDLAYPSSPSSSSSMMIDQAVPLTLAGSGPDHRLASSVAGNRLTNSIGLIADVNMYDVWLSAGPSALTVNPLDTVRVSCAIRSSPLVAPELMVPPYNPVKVELNEDFDTGMLSCEEIPSPMDINDLIVWPLPPVEETKTFAYMSPILSKWKAKATEATSEESLELPSYPKVGYSTNAEPYTLPSASVREREESTSSQSSPIQPSPIVNAHLGIEPDVLTEKAKRFRLRYPGQEIDQPWLLRFAGKLSQQGELMDRFRCYVVGCNQQNKRRDHILVHVGAHVDQRRFSCSMCLKRFLRNNERKRHEATHTGSRPYRCDVCSKAFGRRDLLKRHRQRLHADSSKAVLQRKKRA